MFGFRASVPVLIMNGYFLSEQRLLLIFASLRKMWRERDMSGTKYKSVAASVCMLSVDTLCLNEEKVICYQLELGK